MREDFEQWYKKTYTHFGQAIFLLNANNEYVDDIIEASWKAWQAALSAVPTNNPWQQAIDDELVNTHLGVANNGVTREQAKAELNKLIAWHIDVDKYFESQAQQPVARVADVHLSRYTLEWLNGQIQPEGTLLYISKQPAQEPVSENLKNAVALVLEGWTLPDGVRKILETAYFQEPSTTKTLELLKKAELEIDKHICTHEETHRGGAIWEICDSCNAKWTNNENNKPEFKPNKVSEEIREFLSTKPEHVCNYSPSLLDGSGTMVCSSGNWK